MKIDKDKSIFVEFIHCKDCIYMFKIYRCETAVVHYNCRKNVMRCIGCESLQRFNKEIVKPYEKRKNKDCK